jgi:hypothetical protein
MSLYSTALATYCILLKVKQFASSIPHCAPEYYDYLLSIREILLSSLLSSDPSAASILLALELIEEVFDSWFLFTHY